jgi:hypothetical protein
VALVENVSFSALYQEDDASFMAKLGLSIGGVRGLEAGGKPLGTLVFWEVVLVMGTRTLQQRIFRSSEEPREGQ